MARAQGSRTEQGRPRGTPAQAGRSGSTGTTGERDRKVLGESDRVIVPVKPPKETRLDGATRRVEGRARPTGNLGEGKSGRTPSRDPLSPQLVRVQAVAKSRKEERFTSLAHLLTVEALERAFHRLKRGASAGLDGMTVAEYEQGLDGRLEGLRERLKAGKYRAQPVRRHWIPKADGKMRPLGIPCLEDKVVQSAVAEILNAIYEADFLGFSYGFRENRGPHDALNALQTALQYGKVNWVLDADIRSFFDTIDHEELMAVIQRRIVDGRLLALIRKWFKVGVMDEGRLTRAERGVPQGGSISPVLSNIFLHEVLDRFVAAWRREQARGEVYIVRYCDDFVMAFERKDDAEACLEALREQFRRHKLEFHPDKTRLIPFGRNGTERGADALTFSFLGFTHIRGRGLYGQSLVLRKTERKRFTRSLRAVRTECRERMHEPVREQHRWLSSVLRGHYGYYGLTGNYRPLQNFRHEVLWAWFHALGRRSQCGMNYAHYRRLLEVFPLPRPYIARPSRWLTRRPGDLLGRAGCRKSARPDL